MNRAFKTNVPFQLMILSNLIASGMKANDDDNMPAVDKCMRLCTYRSTFT